VREIFGDESVKELQIPCFIYNQYMGGIDLANQYRETYGTHRATQRNWWPLFYWLIDVACINSFRLYQLYMKQLSIKPISHLEYRVQLYCHLLSYSEKVRLYDLQVQLGGKRLFGSELSYIHHWIKLPVQETCLFVCLFIPFNVLCKSKTIVKMRKTGAQSTLKGLY
jgi:hypothetical protein